MPCGCISLRKKFVRKRQTLQEEPVYVNFKEYPATPKSELYRDYWVFLRGWLDEAIKNIDVSGNRKRAKHSFEEAVANIENIVLLFNEEGKKKIDPLYKELLSAKSDFEKRVNMSEIERDGFLRRVEKIKEDFEYNFAYSRIKPWLE